MLPPQLILARFLLIMEREGIAASQQAQPLPVPLPAPLPALCLLLGGLGGAGAGVYIPPPPPPQWFWAEELGVTLCHSPLPPAGFKRLGQPREGCAMAI